MRVPKETCWTTKKNPIRTPTPRNCASGRADKGVGWEYQKRPEFDEPKETYWATKRTVFVCHGLTKPTYLSAKRHRFVYQNTKKLSCKKALLDSQIEIKWTMEWLRFVGSLKL